MRKTASITFLLLLISTMLWSQGSLTVIIENIREKKGVVYVVLHNNEASYKNSEKERYRVGIINAAKGETSCTIKDLPAGTYVFETFHDEDDNKKLKTNFVGMPKEGFGFSNNALVKMRKPYFREMSFPIEDGKQVVQRIKLKYL